LEVARPQAWSGVLTMRTADAHPFPTMNAPLRFAVALGLTSFVFLIDRAFDRVIDDGTLFLLLGIAVIASAWLAGTGPALAATVTGAVIGAQEIHAVESNVAAQAKLAFFVLQGLLLTVILSELRRARRVAEEQAAQAQQAKRESEAAGRMKDEFLATISHELRTPLNAVLGWVHLLRTGKLDPHTAARGLESIERNARLQAQLTGNLLDISKALTGQLQVESQPLALTDVVRQAAVAAAPAAHAKGVHIVNDLPEQPVLILGDWMRLRQVVWQLLANALKFTARDGTIGVVVRNEAEHALLTVYDSGPGIDPQFLPRIFDRFTQEDASPTRTAGGLGVGLSLVRELVELHGGDISAANRSDGHGAVFTVRFPLQPALSLSNAVGSTQPESFAGASPPLDGLRVLVLDRDREGRELVKTVLEQRGAVVCATDSVAEALEALEGWRPDVLVSDSASPERDSYALIGKVPSLEPDRGGRIPALALTSFARNDEQVRRMLDAALRDLPKPIEPGLLATEIARLTGRERRRAQR
jgi:signal transduction histidine kinase